MKNSELSELKLKLQAVAGEGPLADRFVDSFARLILEKNAFYDTPALIRWLEELRSTETMKVSRMPIRELRKWSMKDTGEIVHDSGGFYEIIGVRIENADREVDSWDQPLVAQQEMGVLGIATTMHEGVRYFLLQGKAEPGNVGLIQISPTLQATFANMRQLHKGKKPPFFDIFAENSPAKVLYRQWLAEDGGRFYNKTNLNVLIEVDGLITHELPRNFRWFTLRQIKELLDHDNFVGPHVRSIISHL